MTAALSWYVFSLGSPGINLSYTEMYAVMVIICLFIALPSVPGFWGVWEAVVFLPFRCLGFQQTPPPVLPWPIMPIQLFPVIVVGFISAIITSVNIWQVSYEKKSD